VSRPGCSEYKLFINRPCAAADLIRRPADRGTQIKISLLKHCCCIALLVAGLAASAHALSNRAWVSGHGTDAAGCGSIASPCRTLQYVHDNIIAAGGEIDILDPAGYGTITITKALSIINDGAGTAGVQSVIPTALNRDLCPFSGSD
jgi:hypothetical protein